MRIGLIGDFDLQVTAHRAIPRALDLAGAEPVWVPTDTIDDAARVAGFDGLWCVPASPYRSTEGALRAIRFAREEGRPFFGTCGGFQHAVLEYARNVLHWSDAEHAELTPESARMVIAPLQCALVEVSEVLRLGEGTKLREAYGQAEIREAYHCSYGLNPTFREALTSGPLRAAAEGTRAGQVRAVELDGHPFFVATLFQPERAALEGRVPPPVRAFLSACRRAEPTRASR